MGEEARVFAEELAKFKFGHALWWPEHTKDPIGEDHDIEIGDVGFIDSDGAFHALLNVTRGPDHTLGTFTPLEYDSSSVETKERFRTPEYPVCGSTVTEHKISAQLAASSPLPNAGGSLSFQFRCHSEQGAFLMLWDDATKTVVQKQELRFIKYMRQHHLRWFSYAREVLGIACKPEDIILVRGFIKTSAWTVAAFLGGSSQSREITLHGQLGPTISVGCGYASLENTTTSPMHQRSGPAHRLLSRTEGGVPLALPSTSGDEPPQKDQCVFLNYFKITYRAKILKKIVAAAEPRDSTRDRPEDDDPPLVSQPGYDVEVERECNVSIPRNPVDILLEYILEFSDADMAIASHNDLESFTLDDQWPETFHDLLRTSLPRIVVNEESVGMLHIVPLTVPMSATAEPLSASSKLSSTTSSRTSSLAQSQSHSGDRGNILPQQAHDSSFARVIPPQSHPTHQSKGKMTRLMPPHVSSPINSLSSKIMKLIFDDLAGDFRTLWACSLVCRSFREQSRRYIFKSISIWNSHLRNLHSGVREFGGFIADSPWVGSIVRKLRLWGAHSTDGGMGSTVPAHMLGSILDGLPNIRILELFDIDITPLESGRHGTPVLWSGSKRKLGVLTLASPDLKNCPSFPVLGLFSAIGVLRIMYFAPWWKAPFPADLKLFLEDLQVHQLSLEEHRLKTVISCGTLCMTYVLLGSVNSLQRVEAECSNMEQLHALGRLLRETGDHLRSIAIDLTNIAKGTEDCTAVTDGLGLEVCTGLLKLRIQIFPEEEGSVSDDWPRTSRLLAALLSNVSPTLTDIIIELPEIYFFCSNYYYVDWEALRCIGDAGWQRFTRLTKVVFVLPVEQPVLFAATLDWPRSLLADGLELDELLNVTTKAKSQSFREDWDTVITEYDTDEPLASVDD